MKNRKENTNMLNDNDTNFATLNLALTRLAMIIIHWLIKVIIIKPWYADVATLVICNLYEFIYVMYMYDHILQKSLLYNIWI